jgi:hypothetical protein
MSENPLLDYFGTPQEFNTLMQIMDTNPEFRSRTIDYVKALTDEVPPETRKTAVSDYAAFLHRFDFDMYNLGDALGDYVEGRR